ncbi:MAG TPA: molybdopterin-dependent oxidoreductase [Candidatus Binatus sp.]|nr:molybdopterin-dependent oxidoreductase [Candidatus Binatus sp.]
MRNAIRSRRLFPAVLLLLVIPLAVLAEAPAVALHVTGEVSNHLELSLADIATLKHRTVRVTDEKGNSIEYGGVAVADILQKAGAPLDKRLRGPAMALGVVASAPDGYRVVYSLAEFDPAFSDRVIILADTRDGKALDSHEGPLRIVAPGDKRGARWIRGVNSLEIVKVR